MNKKKRRVAVLLSATIGSAVLVLSGCSGKSDQTEKTLRVGVITYTQDDPFINGLTDELKAQLKAMENKERRIIVSTKSGNDDQQEQNEKVEEMIDAGCDVLCINLVDRTAPSRIIRMARNEDIPVIFFNREPVREDLMQWEKLYYVGCDAEQSGIMQGEIAAEYINSHPEVDKNEDGKIQYVLLEGEAGHQDAISRTEYSVKTLMKNDVILEKLSYQLADWNRGQAENRMNRLISQYGKEIELVISNNDEMALGAVEAYRTVGYAREDWPVIFGIDGLEDALKAVKAGEMQGSILNDRVDQAKEMAKMAVKLFEGEDFDQENLKEGRYYFSEYQKVDSSNIDEYLSAEEAIAHSEM
ncbi:MAG: substrate-binding domain-containing protein [Blautia wexlerae]